MPIPKEYNYEDVFLVPQKCIVQSRSECDISMLLGSRYFRNPVILANMKAVVDYNTCEYLASIGMFYIMHRFHLVEEEYISFIQKMNQQYFSSISVGIQHSDKEFLQKLFLRHIRLDYITIDIAHAYSDTTLDMCRFIKDLFPDTFLIVGNVATSDAVEFFQKDVDAIKIFVGPGKSCTTKNKTGFTRGCISCLQECSKVSTVPLIADGGIREWGDIAKAFACGASSVMIGSMFAGFDQSPGDIVEIDGHLKYIYYGSASYNNKQHKKHIEGKEIILDYKGDMMELIEDMEHSLRSSISYGGGKELEDLYNVPLICLEDNNG